MTATYATALPEHLSTTETARPSAVGRIWNVGLRIHEKSVLWYVARMISATAKH